MPKSMTADDILPLVASLTPRERVRLLRLITSRPTSDAAAMYHAMPPGEDEFSKQPDPNRYRLENHATDRVRPALA